MNLRPWKHLLLFVQEGWMWLTSHTYAYSYKHTFTKIHSPQNSSKRIHSWASTNIISYSEHGWFQHLKLFDIFVCLSAQWVISGWFSMTKPSAISLLKTEGRLLRRAELEIFDNPIECCFLVKKGKNSLKPLCGLFDNLWILTKTISFSLASFSVFFKPCRQPRVHQNVHFGALRHRISSSWYALTVALTRRCLC